MQKWEYTQLMAWEGDRVYLGGKEYANLTSTLKRYGIEGWELVAAVGERQYHTLYFKRPVE
ncbi:MAG: DUF4177 domain-containing protein [Gammaproteobacteria bacterium]|nr:MAG: DUF4177 domain-containing protein [Gammaproteobacteria bacterium]